jgi:hypothetical protein
MNGNGAHQNGVGGVGLWENGMNHNDNDGPRPTDIIMGRGHGAATHPGNMRFRVTCELHRPRYDATDDKKEKSRIINEILELVKQTARFLKQDPLTGEWFETNDAAARRKIGQVRWRKVVIHAQNKSTH